MSWLPCIEEDMRGIISKVVLVVTAITVAVMPIAAQGPAQRPSFEVASVKRSAPEDTIFVRLGSSGGRFFGTRITLRTLLQIAYESLDRSPLLDSQLIGAPGWVDTDRFDIEAKTEQANAGPIPQEKLQPIMQALLEDRFQLKAHRELRELPVYHLAVARERPKMKLSEDQTPPVLPSQPIPFNPSVAPPRGLAQVRSASAPESGLILRGRAIPVSKLANLLPVWVGRPVIDQTHLGGLFDIQLQFTPSLSEVSGATPPTAQPAVAGPSGTSIFTALQEQLGLKLESAKAPLEVLVIDSVQKPSEN
jgi:uncharacterized protein (TIGR03435 family)